MVIKNVFVIKFEYICNSILLHLNVPLINLTVPILVQLKYILYRMNSKDFIKKYSGVPNYFIDELFEFYNETTKDSLTKQNSKSSSNPLEKVTWVCLIIQLILLLLRTKITDS